MKKHATHRAKFDRSMDCWYPEYWNGHAWKTYRNKNQTYVFHNSKEECQAWLKDAKIAEVQAGIC